MALPVAGVPYFDLWQAMRNAMPSIPGGVSDDLGGQWLQSAVGLYNNALNNTTQLQLQDQTNRIRFSELMGSSGGQQTDAARRWREELQAQQAVQDARLRQEYAQLLGYNPATGEQTLGWRSETNKVQESQAERASREAMQRAQMTQEKQMADAMFNYQNYQATVQQQNEMARLGASQGFQAGESAQERAVRERLQSQQLATGSQESLAERNLRAALQNQQLGSTASESALERQIRQQLQTQQLGVQQTESAQERALKERLQGGQLSQQESEYARTYLLQQEESRRQQAELAGYLSNGQLTEAGRAAREAEASRRAELSGQIAGGGLTEESRAAREQERTQRAALAAQLMQAPKDVFRAGAYFRSLGSSSPLGLGGGGVMGFNPMVDRLGTPGTVSQDDVDQAMQNPAASSWISAPGAGSPGTPGFTAGAATDSGANSLGGSGDEAGGTPERSPRQDLEEGTEPEIPGAEPGGPQGSPDASALALAGLGDLGIGGGGQFAGRMAPAVAGTAPQSPVPFVHPAVFEDPQVKAMLQDIHRQGAKNEVMGRHPGKRGKSGKRPSGPGGPQNKIEYGQYTFGPRSARERRNSDERFLRGAARAHQRGVLPGAGPGGPVDAPLWPEGTAADTAMPALQDPAALGAASFLSTAAPAAPAAMPFTISSAPAPIASVDPAVQDAARAEMRRQLLLGPGAMGPQALEKLSKTQRGLAEGAVQAEGLSWEDFEDSYAQSRFNNVGSVLSA